MHYRADDSLLDLPQGSSIGLARELRYRKRTRRGPSAHNARQTPSRSIGRYHMFGLVEILIMVIMLFEKKSRNQKTYINHATPFRPCAQPEEIKPYVGGELYATSAGKVA